MPALAKSHGACQAPSTCLRRLSSTNRMLQRLQQIDGQQHVCLKQNGKRVALSSCGPWNAASQCPDQKNVSQTHARFLQCPHNTGMSKYAVCREASVFGRHLEASTTLFATPQASPLQYGCRKTG